MSRIIKAACFILLCLISNVHIEAQEKNHFGLRSGILMSNQNWAMHDELSASGDYEIGFTAGIYFQREVTNNFDLQAEINYLRQGSYLPQSWDEYYFDNGTLKRSKVEMNYLSLVLLSKVKFSLNKIRPYLYTGPKFDMLINKTSFGFTLPPNIEKNDYGFSIGAGIEMNLFRKFQAKIEGRFNQGLNKISTISTRTDVIYTTNHSFEFSICIGK